MTKNGMDMFNVKVILTGCSKHSTVMVTYWLN